MLGLRAALFVLLAALLIVFDYHSSDFHRFRQNLSIIILPIQTVVNTPIQWVHWLGSGVAAHQHLLEENAQLKARQLLLQSKLQKLMALERENAQLKGLLQSTTRVPGRVKVAQLLAVDLDPTVMQIVLDKGSRDQVYRGQPVLDAYGVMGQVVDVGLLTSKILLLTNPRLGIPVKNQRNGFRAIAVGMGASQHLALLHINSINKVKIGDRFVTSGLGLHFPVGYPVGVVSRVQKIPGERFIKVSLLPSAHFDQTQQVILVWPSEEKLIKSVRAELKSESS